MFDFEKSKKEININEALISLRQEIGDTPDGQAPSEEIVRVKTEEIFSDIPENLQEKIIAAFVDSETKASDLADAA